MAEPQPTGTDRPLRPQRTLTDAPANGLYLPELRIHVGGDGFGGGMTAYCWVDSGEVRATRLALLEKRWLDRPASTEEAVMVALRGLEWYARKAGYLSE